MVFADFGFSYFIEWAQEMKKVLVSCFVFHPRVRVGLLKYSLVLLLGLLVAGVIPIACLKLSRKVILI